MLFCARPLWLLLLLPVHLVAALPAEQVEFFEKKIRPILAQECYECHNTAGKKKGGLALDSRKGWQEGGDSGEVIIPGHADKSLLLKSIRHEDADLKMPSKGPKLDEPILRDFETWINMGAPDPRDQPSSAQEVAKGKEWPSVFQRRSSWWSLQPIANPAAPEAGKSWSNHPVDRFLAQRLAEAGLEPARDAEPGAILRRLTFTLTGLPPTPEENAAFLSAAAQDLPGAIAVAADRLLASPRFGEKWARHWMDWFRFAETHGSEGDPLIPYAWRYRDYLIRAFNDDVPFPQLVREHIAGDLLEQPRRNLTLGINESALGAAQYRLVLHGFTPTDAYDEQATFTDNQIDTVTKAFLGMTVACARCHDHKFDAISQADYYALFGIFASCRPATVDLNLPEKQQQAVTPLREVKAELKSALVKTWLQSLDSFPDRLLGWTPPPAPPAPANKKSVPTPAEDLGPLADWWELKKAPADKWPGLWAKLKAQAQDQEEKLARFRAQSSAVTWDLRGADFATWQVDGAGVQQGPTPAGEFHVEASGAGVVRGIYPAGVYSHLLSDRQRGLLASPRFAAQGGKIWARLRGDGLARARYVVRNYPRTGTVYPKTELVGENDQWVSWDVSYWKGDTLHVEISTTEDQPVETKNQEASWFGVSEIRYLPQADGFGPPPATLRLFSVLDPATPAPADAPAFASILAAQVRTCLEHWRDDRLNDQEADFLNALVRHNVLPNRLAELPELGSLVAIYRADEAAIATPTRAPGLLEGFAFDQPLFTRGDHKKPAELVPRRFLDAIDNKPYGLSDQQSGRRQLAESLVAPNNPLTPRVIVNRLWQNVFGRGIVASPDNFGRLGELPTHPELLDYLATSFQAQNGSMKAFLRTLVTSRAFRLDHRPATPAAAERDPQNKLLSYYPVRRLEAEGIRDSMLAISGRLDLKVGGDPGESQMYRRSIYKVVRRNGLDPLLTSFDFPVPSATRGQRDSTNVPAQALALLNDPFVTRLAEDWARRMHRDSSLPDDAARVRRMFAEAYNRLPRAAELAASLEFVRAAQADADAQVSELRQQLARLKTEPQPVASEIAAEPPSEATPASLTAAAERKAPSGDLDQRLQQVRASLEDAQKPLRGWHALAQALFNSKEFIYLP